MKSNVVRINKNTISYTPFGPDGYPEQNREYLGRTIMIRYMNDNLGHLFERNATGEDYFKPIFKVLRWDADEEVGKVVLVNEFQEVIVADVSDILSHKWYKKSPYDDICFLIPDEEKATMTEEEFNKTIYSKEKVYRKSPDSEWLQYNKLDPILIEFEKDKLNNRSTDVEEDASDTTEPTRNNGNTESIVENEDSFVNYPFRSSITGFLVKDDIDGMAVAYDYLDEETSRHSFRIVTDKEANFYANHDENSFKILRDKYEQGIGGRIRLWE